VRSLCFWTMGRLWSHLHYYPEHVVASILNTLIVAFADKDDYVAESALSAECSIVESLTPEDIANYPVEQILGQLLQTAKQYVLLRPLKVVSAMIHPHTYIHTCISHSYLRVVAFFSQMCTNNLYVIARHVLFG
jgi:hypothetical protein